MRFSLALDNGKEVSFAMTASPQNTSVNAARTIIEWEDHPRELLDQFVDKPEHLDLIPEASIDSISLWGLYLLLVARFNEYYPRKLPRNAIRFEKSKLKHSRVADLFDDDKEDITMGEYQLATDMKKDLMKRGFPLPILGRLFEPQIDPDYLGDHLSWATYVDAQFFLMTSIVIVEGLKKVPIPTLLQRKIAEFYLKTVRWQLPDQ